MLGQFEDMIIEKLVQQLNSHGITISAETVKKAVANSPQVVAQIQGILMATSSEDRLEKVKALLQQAAAGGDAATSGTTANKSK